MTHAPEWNNKLYYGDNLGILERYVEDEAVDLVYLDPPFKSNADYNILFREKDGSKAASQLRAFGDTWEWNEEASRTFFAFIESAEPRASKALRALRLVVGDSDMLAYLSMMAPRLVELRRVLKPTGSLYLHCDPTASHYLKLLLDAVFHPENFKNEVVWRRTRSHNDTKLTRFGAVHDTIFFYSKSKRWTFNKTFTERADHAPKTHDLYRHSDGKLYRKGDCRAPGGRGPRYEWNGYEHHWRFTQEERKRLESEGRIVFSKTGMPRVLRPVDPKKGPSLQDLWTDIDAPNSGSAENLPYPTQKPLALLERIIFASSNEGDLILDPFCGCGTAIAASQKLNRRWIGIDITQPAIVVIKQRLRDLDVSNYKVVGEPVSVPDAQVLAHQDPYQFQWWALGLVGARPVPAEEKKGADRGVDGRLLFHDGRNETKEIIFSVKAGKLHAPYIRDLVGVVAREKAEIGVLVSFERPTRSMIAEAASAGVYTSPWGRKAYSKIQLLTIEEIMNGKTVDYPRGEAGEDRTFRKGPVSEKGDTRQKQRKLFA